ncbi:MAG: glycosyltransferase family 4 protein [Chloroflexi bacterium]|nr:glycosyltransferase family 4 protein [Chloroflexota bacterium]
MKIGISARGLGEGSYAISTIILQLTLEIIERIEKKHDIFLYFNDPSHEKLFSSRAFKRSFNLKNRFIWDHFWLPQALKNDNIDIAIFMKGTIPFFLPCRAGIILHDLGYFNNQLRPYRPSETVYMKTMLARSVKEASFVFADSEYTRNEAIRILGVNPDKVNTCYQNCSSNYHPVTNHKKRNAIRKTYNLPDNFIFCPISLSPRKNFHRILSAFDKVKKDIPHDIVITGGQQWGIDSLIQKKNYELYKRVHILGHVSNEDMAGLYSLADFALYPSLLEGFGLPVLEAFRCDCPILTSNTTSIPEVAGDAAYLVNPYDIDQIAEGITSLALKPSLRQTLITKGHEQAKKFSWERTAQIILNTIEAY